MLVLNDSRPTRLSELIVKIYADGGDKLKFTSITPDLDIKGFTTNPTLMRKAGVNNYEKFAKDILNIAGDRPVSFEVFADDLESMESQAVKISSWGKNVNVKIPITNTKGQSTSIVVQRLASRGIVCNVTAIFTLDQIREIVDCLPVETPSIISVFAGRIADTGRDPIPIMKRAIEIAQHKPNIELLWASPREVLNVYQANEIGCHIITLTSDLLTKLTLIDKDLAEFSLETVSMFFNDAQAAGYSLIS